MNRNTASFITMFKVLMFVLLDKIIAWLIKSLRAEHAPHTIKRIIVKVEMVCAISRYMYADTYKGARTGI